MQRSIYSDPQICPKKLWCLPPSDHDFTTLWGTSDLADDSSCEIIRSHSCNSSSGTSCESKIGGLWLGSPVSPGWTSGGSKCKMSDSGPSGSHKYRTFGASSFVPLESRDTPPKSDKVKHHPRFTVKVETLNSKFDMEFSFQWGQKRRANSSDWLIHSVMTLVALVAKLRYE